MSEETFGKRLKIARDKSNLTQKQVAELLGISVRAVQDHESDKHRPGNNTINGYVRVLKCDKHWLLGVEKAAGYNIGGKKEVFKVSSPDKTQEYGLDPYIQATAGLKEIFDLGDPISIKAIQANIEAFRVSALREYQNQEQADEINNLKEEYEDLKKGNEEVKKRLTTLEEKHKAGDPHTTASLKKSAM